MTDTTKDFTVRFARLPRRGLLLGLSAPRVACIGLAALVLVPAMFTASTFGAIVTGDDTERHKPAPDPLLLALAQLGANASTAVYVGDSPFDVQAAKAAGMTAVAVGWGRIHPRERLEAETPDVLVDWPEELLREL